MWLTFKKEEIKEYQKGMKKRFKLTKNTLKMIGEKKMKEKSYSNSI